MGKVFNAVRAEVELRRVSGEFGRARLEVMEKCQPRRTVRGLVQVMVLLTVMPVATMWSAELPRTCWCAQRGRRGVTGSAWLMRPV